MSRMFLLTWSGSSLKIVNSLFPDVRSRRHCKEKAMCFFHSFTLNSVLLSLEPTLLVDFFIDLRLFLSLFTHYVHESVGGVKRAAM